MDAARDQIIIVLPYLGVLVIVLAPLALLLRRMPVLTVGLAAGLAVVAPVIVDRAGLVANENVATWPGWLSDLMGWVATGGAYRLATLLPMALGGLALAAVLRQVTRLPQAWVVAAGATHGNGAAGVADPRPAAPSSREFGQCAK